MSQLTGYSPLLPSARRLVSVPRPAVAPAVAPAERSLPSILAFLVSVYLCSVPLLSTSEHATSWIPQVIAIGVGVGWLVFGVLFRGLSIVWAKPITLYLAWTLWAASGLMVTLRMDYFLTQWFAIIKVAAITWVASQCIRTRSDLLTCLLLLSLTSLVVFVMGTEAILQAATYSGTREEVGARAEGTLMTNANELGGFGVISLLAALTGMWCFRSTILKLLAAAPIPAALYIIAASGSRMAMVGVLVAGVGLYFLHLRKLGDGGAGRKLAMLLAGMALAGGSIYYVSKNPFFFRLQAAFADQSAVQEQPRFRYFMSGLGASIGSPVFGLGIGGFALNSLGGTGNLSHYSHSTLTETFTCTGWPGFALYFGGQLAMFNMIRKLRKLSLPRYEQATVNMLMVLFVTVMLMSVVTVMHCDRLNWPVFGACCGYLVALRKRYPSAPAQPLGSFAR